MGLGWLMGNSSVLTYRLLASRPRSGRSPKHGQPGVLGVPLVPLSVVLTLKRVSVLLASGRTPMSMCDSFGESSTGNPRIASGSGLGENAVTVKKNVWVVGSNW